MSQRFKTVYFSDYPAESSREKNLTLAFGVKDDDTYELVQGLSSHELRELIGHPTFASLQQAAEQEELAVNTYCLRLLRQKHRAARESSAQYHLPGLADENDIIFEPIQTTFKGDRPSRSIAGIRFWKVIHHVSLRRLSVSSLQTRPGSLIRFRAPARRR